MAFQWSRAWLLLLSGMLASVIGEGTKLKEWHATENTSDDTFSLLMKPAEQGRRSELQLVAASRRRRSDEKELQGHWNQSNASRMNLPICRLFPTDYYCNRTSGGAMMAQAMMWESSGIGGWFVPVLVLMSYIGGICLSALLDGLFQKDEVNLPEDPPNLEQTLGPPRHSSHFSAGTVTGGVICHSGLLDVVDASGRWWWMAPGFSRPLATVKLYICLLLLTELFSLQIPSGSVLSTPELISLEPHYPEPIPDTPAMAQWLMPGFESNIASWLDFLGGLRWMLLISWCVFLLLPKAHGLWQVVASASYTCGALVFCYFIVLNIMFEGHHCLQATFYFVFSCILALPFLETNPRAANWLWRFLFLTLIPCYLFAGFSKIHFHGLRTNLTGGWLVGVIDGKKGAAPGFVGFVAFLRSAPGILGSAVPWPYMCMSWGNLLVELVLPIAAMLSMKPDKLSTLIRVTFCLAAAGFHVLVLLLKGPNFMHNIVLLIIACNPLCLFDLGRAPPGAQTEDPSKSADRGSQRQQLASWGDRFRSAYAMIILLLWYGADFQNHWNHVTGQVPIKDRSEMLFPFPSFNMFTYGGKEPNPQLSCGLFVLAFVALLLKMLKDVKDQDNSDS
ncbi:unnamed protein product [Durusdinium trenchii]|uniref:Uncharacterized protein n=1 Tax=Durusdinium trenchii TaxID=1381693 RepID=A0ABP0LNR4_9DINO